MLYQAWCYDGYGHGLPPDYSKYIYIYIKCERISTQTGLKICLCGNSFYIFIFSVNIYLKQHRCDHYLCPQSHEENMPAFLLLLLKCSSDILYAYSQDFILVIIVPADGLAPTGARPSAGTMLTTKLHVCSSKLLKLPMILNDIELIISFEHEISQGRLV